MAIPSLNYFGCIFSDNFTFKSKTLLFRHTPMVEEDIRSCLACKSLNTSLEKEGYQIKISYFLQVNIDIISVITIIIIESNN